MSGRLYTFAIALELGRRQINARHYPRQAEPLLGPIELRALIQPFESPPGSRCASRRESPIDWIIAGAESGPGARPMDEEWVRSLRDQCQEANVAFFYKQAVRGGRVVSLPELDGARWAEFPEDVRVGA